MTSARDLTMTAASAAGAATRRTEDRRASWHRQATLTSVTGVAARLLSIAVRLVTIPLALHLLGPDRYGLWLAVGSMLAWVAFVGPGLGYGLINALSDARGRDDWTAMRAHVSTAVLTIVPLGVLLLALSPILGAWPGLAHLLGIGGRGDLVPDAVALVRVAAALVALAMAMEFIGPLCSGLQEGYLASIASAAANLAMLTGVSLLAWFGGDLVDFALVVGLPPVVANAALALYLLYRRHPQLRPSWRLWNHHSFRFLAGFGGWMLLSQIGELAIFQSANVMIANRLGPGEVPRYAVPAALFFALTNACYLIVQSYWPALKEASVRHDWDFVRTTMARTLKTRTLLMAVAGTAIVIAGPDFIRMWAGESGVPGRTLLLAMSVYYVLIAWTGNYVVLLLGLGFVRLKALLALSVGASHIAAFFVLSPYLGLSAIPVGGGLAVLMDGLVSRRAVSRYIREHAAARTHEVTI